jgi:hypothetical protein
VLIALGVVGLGATLFGFFLEPGTDRGVGSVVFHFTAVLWVPTLLGFLITADRTRLGKDMGPLVVSVAFFVAAFLALFFLEQMRWAATP